MQGSRPNYAPIALLSCNPRLAASVWASPLKLRQAHPTDTNRKRRAGTPGPPRTALHRLCLPDSATFDFLLQVSLCLLARGRSLSRPFPLKAARSKTQVRCAWARSSTKPPPLARASAARSYRRLSSSCRHSLVPQPPLARSCSRSLVQPLARAAARSCSRSLVQPLARSLVQPPPRSDARSLGRLLAQTLARSDVLARMLSLGCSRSDALARMLSLGCSRSDALLPLSSLLLSLYISVCIDCVKRVNVNGALSLLRYSYSQQPGVRGL